MLARDEHHRRQGMLDSFQQNDRLVMLIERLREILQRQLAERDTSIDWEDGEVRDEQARH